MEINDTKEIDNQEIFNEVTNLLQRLGFEEIVICDSNTNDKGRMNIDIQCTSHGKKCTGEILVYKYKTSKKRFYHSTINYLGKSRVIFQGQGWLSNESKIMK